MPSHRARFQKDLLTSVEQMRRGQAARVTLDRPGDKIEVEIVNVPGQCVQLDLEAKGLVVRDRSTKPLRWRRGAGQP